MMIFLPLLGFGGDTITEPGAIAAILFGVILVWWALTSRPVRSTSGLISKLRLLLQNYGEGPDLFGRVFFGGLAFILIGIFALTMLR